MAEYFSDALLVISTLASLGALAVGIANSRSIEQVHLLLNSRMDQLLSLRGEASKAEGVEQERKHARESGNGDEYIIGRLKK